VAALFESCVVSTGTATAEEDAVKRMKRAATRGKKWKEEEEEEEEEENAKQPMVPDGRW
jgi:ribosomal protein L12E/L44/L45/RPP1/RPP2